MATSTVGLLTPVTPPVNGQSEDDLETFPVPGRGGSGSIEDSDKEFVKCHTCRECDCEVCRYGNFGCLCEKGLTDEEIEEADEQPDAWADHEDHDCKKRCDDCRHEERAARAEERGRVYVRPWKWTDEEVAPLGYIDFSLFLDGPITTTTARRAIRPILEDIRSRSNKSLRQQLLIHLTHLLNNPTGRVVAVQACFSGKDEWEWKYNTSSAVDLAGFLFKLLAPRFRQIAAATFHPAPMIEGAPNPCFDYSLDTLFLEYRKCGTKKEEYNQYLAAIRYAVGQISRQNKNKPIDQQLQRLMVTYCPQTLNQLRYDGAEFIKLFLRLGPTLQYLELVEHHHHMYKNENGYDALAFNNSGSMGIGTDGDLTDANYIDITETKWPFDINVPGYDTIPASRNWD